jgi:hypothetical protein
MRNEYGRTIQYDPDGPVIQRPSEAEIHEANSWIDPRNCDCVACLGIMVPILPSYDEDPPF